MGSQPCCEGWLVAVYYLLFRWGKIPRTNYLPRKRGVQFIDVESLVGGKRKPEWGWLPHSLRRPCFLWHPRHSPVHLLKGPQHFHTSNLGATPNTWTFGENRFKPYSNHTRHFSHYPFPLKAFSSVLVKPRFLLKKSRIYSKYPRPSMPWLHMLLRRSLEIMWRLQTAGLITDFIF